MHISTEMTKLWSSGFQNKFQSGQCCYNKEPIYLTCGSALETHYTTLT